MTPAAEHDVPIPYMQRTRDYYQALGFAPYRWAHFADVPFTPLARPLAQSRVALITTAAPYQPGLGDQGPGAKYNASAKYYKVYDVYAPLLAKLDPGTREKLLKGNYARLFDAARAKVRVWEKANVK